MRRIQRLLRKHNASISKKIWEATQLHLTPIAADQREAVRMRQESLVGKLPSDERCFEGIVTNASSRALFKEMAASKVTAKKWASPKKDILSKKQRHAAKKAMKATGKKRPRAMKQVSRAAVPPHAKGASSV